MTAMEIAEKEMSGELSREEASAEWALLEASNAEREQRRRERRESVGILFGILSLIAEGLAYYWWVTP